MPVRLTVAAAVGIALEAPIFVAIILVFALVGFFGAALEAWIATTGQIVRQEDIGKRISDSFKSVREEVGRQIQVHMANVGNADAGTTIAGCPFSRAVSASTWIAQSNSRGSR